MDESEICVCINTARPVMVALTDFDNEDGHMIIICGYDTYNIEAGSIIKYYVRDSNYSEYKIVSGMSNNMILMQYYAENFVSRDYAY